MSLRPYQERTIDRIRAEWSLGKRRVCAVLPTGAGKTVTGADVVRRAVANGKRCLWLTHRVELADQSSKVVPCRVGMIDTMISREDYPEVDLVVFDECHHAQADTWGQYLARLCGPKTYVLGLTATPERGDGQGLEFFDSLVVGATSRELTDLGILVPMRVLRPEAPLRSGTIAASVAEAYAEHAQGTSAIVFSPTVELAEKHAEELRASGVQAQCVHGATPPALRSSLIQEFRSGVIKVLTNVAVLTEGFDAPECETIILARGCGTTGTFDQIVGRALRSAPGKRDALLIDLRGVSHIHGMPISGREYSLTGVGISKSEVDSVRYCRVCGAIVAPGTPCPDCGRVPEPQTLRVMKQPLRSYDYVAALRDDPPELRLYRLTRWVATARSKGHNPKQAWGKFRALYGAGPTPAMWIAAMRGA
jgi:superfamily II DNA or RNA helicase